MTAVLSVEGLHAGYTGADVLEDVSLDVAAGEIVAVVGRNGAGKTTLLRCIAGRLAPRAGRIRFDGDPHPGDVVEAVRRGIALVPEDRRILPGLTVRENLELAKVGGAEGDGRWSVDRVLETFGGLERRADRNGATLSGGEQQMLAIGRALLTGPALLLLDEPTEGLAPAIIDRIEDVVAELADAGICILLVEQNLEVALDLADRVVVLDRGRVVFEGTPDALLDDGDIVDRYLGVRGAGTDAGTGSH